MTPRRRLALTVAAALLFCFVLARATVVGFTTDEALSYVHFVRGHAFEQGHYDRVSANNHLLNTACMRACDTMLGNSELALRLPNVVAFGVYLAAAWLLLAPLGEVGALGWVLLGLNPFVLEFFALARGYGLMLACLMLSLYFAWRSLEDEHPTRHALLAAAGGIVGVLANFSFVYSYLSVVVCLLAITLWRRQLAAAAGICGLTALLLAWLLPLLHRLQAAGAFWGNSAGAVGMHRDASTFWTNSVLTLLDASLYERPYAALLAPAAATFVAIVSCAAAAVVVAAMFTRGRVTSGRCDLSSSEHSLRWLALVLAVGAGTVVAMCGAHALAGVRYGEERGVLFLYPLFILVLGGLVARVAADTAWAGRALAALTMLAGLHVACSANFTTTLDWPETRYVQPCLEALLAQPPPHTLSTGGTRQAVFEYYCMRHHIDSVVVAGSTPAAWRYTDNAPALDVVQRFADGSVLARAPAAQEEAVSPRRE